MNWLKIILFLLSAAIAIGGLHLTKPERPRLAKILILLIFIATIIGVVLEMKDAREYKRQLDKAEEAYRKIDEQHSVIMERDRRISELEKQSKILRSLEAKIDCVFSGNWVDHPSELIPVGWNKSQSYVQLVSKDDKNNPAIFLYLESVDLKKMEDNSLKVTLVVKTQAENQQIGSDLVLLKDYNGVIVHIPFLDYNDTSNHQVILKIFEATFIVNGSRKVYINQQASFIVPIPENQKLARFQLNRENLFSAVIP